MKQQRRFHFTKSQLSNGWICYDRLTKLSGSGITIEMAFQNCMMELEMDTSDIHK